ncbi:unnamed protein product, partial [Adineta steineri]
VVAIDSVVSSSEKYVDDNNNIFNFVGAVLECASKVYCDGGACQSQTPDYDSPSYNHQDTSEINYKCICPMYMSGEQCEESQYPFGYCINNGTLIYTLDIYNRSMESCICSEGFQGIHCEENIDDCVGVRCSNHGVCQDETNNYTCSCFDGYYGGQCQYKNVETFL